MFILDQCPLDLDDARIDAILSDVPDADDDSLMVEAIAI